MPGPSAIVPAFNEESRIGQVLEVLATVPSLGEILVVDDGSGDGTAEIARAAGRSDPRLRVLRLEANGGKSSAMAVGVREARSDLLVFLDADLRGLRPDHVENLVQPVARGGFLMSVALFREGRPATDWSHRLAPFLSGQRCLDRRLWDTIPGVDEAGWAVEVALSWHAWRQGLPVAWVPWDGATHAMRPEKLQAGRGIASHVRMWAEIARYLSLYGGPVRTDREFMPRRRAV